MGAVSSNLLNLTEPVTQNRAGCSQEKVSQTPPYLPFSSTIAVAVVVAVAVLPISKRLEMIERLMAAVAEVNRLACGRSEFAPLLCVP